MSWKKGSSSVAVRRGGQGTTAVCHHRPTSVKPALVLTTLLASKITLDLPASVVTNSQVSEVSD